MPGVVYMDNKYDQSFATEVTEIEDVKDIARDEIKQQLLDSADILARQSGRGILDELARLIHAVNSRENPNGYIASVRVTLEEQR
jgi:hypothetical protein